MAQIAGAEQAEPLQPTFIFGLASGAVAIGRSIRGHYRLLYRPVAIAPGHRQCAQGKQCAFGRAARQRLHRSEEHTSELQSLMRISYAVFCLKKKTNK